MVDVKRRFSNEIAARLSGAPESDAKADMIEELAENLASRYADMTSDGMGEGEAFARAMEELGDTEELTAYLHSLGPDEPLPGDWQDQNIPSDGVLRLAVDVPGDVTVYVGSGPDGPVRIEGDQRKLDVFTAPDGTLTVRKKPTASSVFFSLRGMSWGEVSLTVPARRWESVAISTASGDVDMGGGLEIGELSVRTASGDVECRVNSCEKAQFKTASGDIEARGNFVSLRAETASGDVELDGPLGEVTISTASGDIELDGSVARVKAGTMSGDVHVESMTMPQAMTLSSKSGDVEAHIPVMGPFKADLRSVSGDTDMDDFGAWPVGDGSEPHYTLTSVSGDVALKRPG